MKNILLVLSLVVAAPLQSPLDTTRGVLEKTRQIVSTDQSRDEKLGALGKLLTGYLDTDVMARQALSVHWADFSKAQQQEFLVLFRELFQRTYVQKLLLFDKPDFAYDGEEVGPDGARVDTRIITPKDEFKVTYRMREEAGRWMATDIQIEDLSLTQSFRRQLDKLLRSSPPDVVLERMRKKYGPSGAGEGAL